ncbi:MAG: hypothetical protein AAFQ09_02765 [Pseudomonadota bacterium]
MKQRFLLSAGARASAVFLAAAFALPGMSTADEIVLSSYDGSTNIVGNLVTYEDGRYHIETALGELLVSANLVMCNGLDCPSKSLLERDLIAATSSKSQTGTVATSLPSN